jgi:hypothetical protein
MINSYLPKELAPEAQTELEKEKKNQNKSRIAR